MMWSESIVWSLCFPMPLYSGIIKILSLLFNLPNQWRSQDFCPNSPFYTALLRGRRLQYELITCSCLMLWLVSADNRVSASDTVSRLKLKLRRTSLLHCNFPCNRFISVQIGLKRESDNKWNKTRAGAKTGRAGWGGVASQVVSR